jgi:arginine dihydrolase
MTPARTKARFLMCRPNYFAVLYQINPWMDPRSWASDGCALHSTSRREWARLHDCLLDCGAEIELVTPSPGLPDLAFTANAAVVLDGKALLSRFRYPQRQPEQALYAAAFDDLCRRGVIDEVKKLPPGLLLEGAGDCVWDSTRKLFWMGYGPRSDHSAQFTVIKEFGADVVALELVDPRFYHMDTALRPLPQGELMYVPSAFSRRGLATIREFVEPANRVELAEADAMQLAANAVCIDRNIILSECSQDLRNNLEMRGYIVCKMQLGTFLRSGGSAFCLTLQLDLASEHAPGGSSLAAA